MQSRAEDYSHDSSLSDQCKTGSSNYWSSKQSPDLSMISLMISVSIAHAVQLIR